MAIINTKVREFRDIDMNFTAHPGTKDVTQAVNESAIKQAIRTLVSTKNYERKFHPEIGCQVNSLLFENYVPKMRNIMKKTITDVINNFEPRAILTKLDIVDNADSNEINIRVEFRMTNTTNPIIVNTVLRRAR